jgi:hypothetical protein
MTKQQQHISFTLILVVLIEGNKGTNILPRGKQIAAPKTEPSATFLARQRSDPGTNT